MRNEECAGYKGKHVEVTQGDKKWKGTVVDVEAGNVYRFDSKDVVLSLKLDKPLPNEPPLKLFVCSKISVKEA